MVRLAAYQRSFLDRRWKRARKRRDVRRISLQRWEFVSDLQVFAQKFECHTYTISNIARSIPKLKHKRKPFLLPPRSLQPAMPYVLAIAWSTLAHAQSAGGTINLENLTTFMKTVTTACQLVGSLAILIGLIFSVFGFVGGNILRGVTGAFGAVLGAGIIGWGPSWVSSLTGQSVG